MEAFHVVGTACGHMGYPTVPLQQPGQKLRCGDTKDPHRKGTSTPLHSTLNDSPVTHEEMKGFPPFRCYGRRTYNPSKVWQNNRNIGAK